MTVADSDNYLYVLTQWGFARAPLGDRKQSRALQLRRHGFGGGLREPRRHPDSLRLPPGLQHDGRGRGAGRDGTHDLRLAAVRAGRRTIRPRGSGRHGRRAAALRRSDSRSTFPTPWRRARRSRRSTSRRPESTSATSRSSTPASTSRTSRARRATLPRVPRSSRRTRSAGPRARSPEPASACAPRTSSIPGYTTSTSSPAARPPTTSSTSPRSTRARACRRRSRAVTGSAQGNYLDIGVINNEIYVFAASGSSGLQGLPVHPAEPADRDQRPLGHHRKHQEGRRQRSRSLPGDVALPRRRRRQQLRRHLGHQVAAGQPARSGPARSSTSGPRTRPTAARASRPTSSRAAAPSRRYVYRELNPPPPGPATGAEPDPHRQDRHLLHRGRPERAADSVRDDGEPLGAGTPQPGEHQELLRRQVGSSRMPRSRSCRSWSWTGTSTTPAPSPPRRW